MSERDVLAPGESATDRPAAGARPGLFDRLRALFGLAGASIRDDIQDALADTSTDVDVSPQERAMLRNVLGLHEVQVEDVMVPRADIIAVSLDSSMAEVLETFRLAGHSRLPVHGDTLDDPRGMVHIRDFLAFLTNVATSLSETAPPETSESESSPDGDEIRSEAARVDPARFVNLARLDMSLAKAGIIRPVLFVPPSMPALDLLVKMQATRTHMALVIDEYGGTDGLASIEDIVEVIVGDIEDEHDLDESPRIDSVSDGSFIVDARAGLEYVSSATGCGLTEISDAEEVDTLGGLITTLAGRVPVRGEIITEDGIEFEVLDADPRRVKRIRIRVSEDSPFATTKADPPERAREAKTESSPDSQD
ncbi:hemolysin family protein [Methylocapsa palsarum]|uniref:CBS domain-containing protein n=1 Tax=Methylocapsa palsarum TaxID=1612308 RepID=A0A1I3Z6P3_9HYPH|nr:hemolysin family protein [Methylocapsa palsarum]SFK39794.1 CBS domain-containing protein [Methylocapsa palsarum]